LLLARPPETITVGEVFRTFEAPVPFTECFAGETGDCPLIAVCRLKCMLSEALAAFYARLDQASIADLVSKNNGLQHILHVA
jgi:Rrf2 family nitric oxide-sensitive transcriptional repressor